MTAGDPRESDEGAVGPGEDEPYRPTPLLSVAWRVVAGLAALGALVLAVGIALPGTWTATETVTVDAPPEEVFGHLTPLERWDDWTVWGSVEAERFGPERGVGAGRSWDDPYMGDGIFQVTGYEPPSRLAYHVEVQGGSMTTDGELRLEAAGGGTRVTWTESGDFGWNPLMGYAALTMDRIQAVELRRGLQRLQALAEDRPVPDSLAIPAPGDAPR